MISKKRKTNALKERKKQTKKRKKDSKKKSELETQRERLCVLKNLTLSVSGRSHECVEKR